MASKLDCSDLQAARRSDRLFLFQVRATVPPTAAQLVALKLQCHQDDLDACCNLISSENLVISHDSITHWGGIPCFHFARPAALHAAAIPVVVRVRPGKLRLATAADIDDDRAAHVAYIASKKGLSRSEQRKVAPPDRNIFGMGVYSRGSAAVDGSLQQYYEIDLKPPTKGIVTRFEKFANPRPVAPSTPPPGSAPSADACPTGTTSAPAGAGACDHKAGFHIVGKHQCNVCPLAKCRKCRILAPPGSTSGSIPVGPCVCAAAGSAADRPKAKAGQFVAVGDDARARKVATDAAERAAAMFGSDDEGTTVPSTDPPPVPAIRHTARRLHLRAPPCPCRPLAPRHRHPLAPRAPVPARHRHPPLRAPRARVPPRHRRRVTGRLRRALAPRAAALRHRPPLPARRLRPLRQPLVRRLLAGVPVLRYAYPPPLRCGTPSARRPLARVAVVVTTVLTAAPAMAVAAVVVVVAVTVAAVAAAAVAMAVAAAAAAAAAAAVMVAALAVAVPVLRYTCPPPLR